MESKDAEGAIDLFAMVLFTMASVAIGYAGYEGFVEGFMRSLFPLIAGAMGAAYFGLMAYRTTRTIVAARARPDSPEEYGDNGYTIRH